MILDELDRLESKEDVLNIFKVIRYLTSFDKVFTITGLDINKLPKGIELEYTHKIFNSKYIIPKTTRRELLTFITEEGSKQQLDFIDKEEFKAILNTNIRNIDLCLIDFIKNYREAKSILNDTYLFCNSLKENPRFKDNWNEFINFELILVLNILKCVNLEFYQKLMNLEENIKVLIINNLESVEIEKLFKKFSEEIKSAQNKNEESVLNQFLKTQKIFNIFKNKKFIITNLDQQIYVYTHQNIYEYMFTENEYKDFIEVEGKIEHKINKLDEITIQKNTQQSDKDKFIILLIKRLYYETNIPNIEKVIKEIFKNIELMYFTNNIIHNILESNFKLNIIEELFKFYLNNIDRENKDLIENLIYKVFNFDQKYVLIKLLFKYLKNSDYQYDLKKLFMENIFLDESTEKLKELIILINSIFEQDYNTFFKDKEIYRINLNTGENSFSLEDISGQRIKEIINANVEPQKELKNNKKNKIKK